MPGQFDFDFIVIGSGFGGSVSAHRLTEKGYRVGVMEMGKRWQSEDFPETNWLSWRYLWFPALRWFGSFRMTLFRHAFVLSGAGVGGGSLNYANVLLVPPNSVWKDPRWAKLRDWETIMPEHYQTAKKMLGVTVNPCYRTADTLLKDTAEVMGIGDTFSPTDVSIYFGEKGKTVPDPFFDGKGPERTGCELCGGCMVGCRYGGKNTLDKNYLYLAEHAGAQVFPETLVTDVRPIGGAIDGGDGYEVHTESSTNLLFKNRHVHRTRGVVFSGGVLGTVKLLMESKHRGSLPLLSDQLGQVVRTNSESIIGVRFPESAGDMSEGVAIGSGVWIDDHTHIEATRYSAGSDALGLLFTILPQFRPSVNRVIVWLGDILCHPLRFLKVINPLGLAKSTNILLVMQDYDGRIKLRLKRSLFPPFRQKLATSGDPIPACIPQANVFAEKMAEQFGGTPVTGITEILFNVPTTAHILGGATMGENSGTGVIDGENRVFNYKNMYVCDGSVVSANLAVNPSLTITALTEQAMSHVKTSRDTRWNETGGGIHSAITEASK
jgi:cholesterol oxidase